MPQGGETDSTHPAHQPHRPRIGRQLLIGRNQQQAISAGLGQQQPIKGIAMQGRQCGHRQGVMGLDGQFLPAAIKQGSAQHGRLHPEIVPP